MVMKIGKVGVYYFAFTLIKFTFVKQPLTLEKHQHSSREVITIVILSATYVLHHIFDVNKTEVLTIIREVGKVEFVCRIQYSIKDFYVSYPANWVLILSTRKHEKSI